LRQLRTWESGHIIYKNTNKLLKSEVNKKATEYTVDKNVKTGRLLESLLAFHPYRKNLKNEVNLTWVGGTLWLHPPKKRRKTSAPAPKKGITVLKSMLQARSYKKMSSILADP
jgi:hypothetical protein